MAREISPAHSQSKWENSQNSLQGCYFENIVSREVFEKRKSFILWICLRVRMDSRNRSFPRMGLSRKLALPVLISKRLGDPFLVRVSVRIIPEIHEIPASIFPGVP